MWQWHRKSLAAYTAHSGKYATRKTGLTEQEMGVFHKQLGMRSLSQPKGANLRDALTFSPVVFTDMNQTGGHAMVVAGYNDGKYTVVNPATFTRLTSTMERRTLPPRNTRECQVKSKGLSGCISGIGSRQFTSTDRRKQPWSASCRRTRSPTLHAGVSLLFPPSSPLQSRSACRSSRRRHTRRLEWIGERADDCESASHHRRPPASDRRW